VAFFLAEMGDKTQILTVALAAQYQSPLMVTLASTLGLMGANLLVLIFGQAFLKRVPLKWMRLGASLLFLVFALLIYLH
jgi:putative Ca2+/H+ antiporter (TMEM165/GDT1 family)